MLSWVRVHVTGPRVSGHVQAARREAQATQAALAQRRARLSATDRGALLGEAQLAAGSSGTIPQIAGRPDVSGIAGLCLHGEMYVPCNEIAPMSDASTGSPVHPECLVQQQCCLAVMSQVCRCSH